MDGKEREIREEHASQETEVQGAKGFSAFLRATLRGTLFALWGYLLGGAALPFGAAPFGIALLSASDGRAIFVLLGLCLGAAFQADGIFLCAVFVALFALRILCRIVLDLPAMARGDGATLGDLAPHLFREHLGLCMANAAVGAFAIGMRRLMMGGFLYYDLYGTILSTLAAPVATLLFIGFFRRNKEGNAYLVGLLALTAAVCFSLRGQSLYGISLASLSALLVTLYLGYRKGVVWGSLGGAAFGLATAPALSPLFIFCGIFSGLIFPHSATLALLASLATGLGWGYYVQGLGLLNGLFGALLAAHLLFGVWVRFFEGEKEAVAEKTEATRDLLPKDGYAERIRFSDTSRRIHSLSRSLATLSKRFDAMARRMQRPDREALRSLGERAFDGTCTSCPLKDSCFGDRYAETSAAMESLFAALCEQGSVRREDAPLLGERCSRFPDLLEEINQNAAHYKAELLASDRTELLSTDLSVLSGLLASVMAEGEGEYEADPSVSSLLSAAMEEDIGVCVVGKRKRRIGLFGASVASLPNRDRLKTKVEALLGLPLSIERADEEEGILLLEECPKLRIQYATRQANAPDEQGICGDTVKAFHDDEGRFYALISDGMGAGESAAMTSESTGIFLEELLRAGGDRQEILKLLNGFLRSRGSGSLRECSATVDLLEYDLLGRQAVFYKSGAAPTYVMRDGGFFKLKARTLPMGIIQGADVQTISFAVGAGDLIVMLSDGVTQGREECPRLFDLLHSHVSSDIDRLADLILKYAKEEGSTDDISVLVIKIEEDVCEP